MSETTIQREIVERLTRVVTAVELRELLNVPSDATFDVAIHGGCDAIDDDNPLTVRWETRRWETDTL